MKRFIAVVFSLSILAVWAIFDAIAAPSSVTKRDNTSVKVQNKTDDALKASHSGDMAVPVTVADVRIAPVFDSTGVVVSDPTGTILSLINP